MGKLQSVTRDESFIKILSYAYIGQVDWPSSQSTEYKLAQNRSPQRKQSNTVVGDCDSLKLKTMNQLQMLLKVCVHVFICFCVPAALSGIPSDQSSGTSSPLCDSGLHLNYHPNNTVLFSLSSLFARWFCNCPPVTMQQRSHHQKAVSMQLSLLTDNQDALSLSSEKGESAFLCSLPVHRRQWQQQQALDMSTVWNVQGGKWQAFLNCLSHFCRTRCPARPGPRPLGFAGRRDG